MSAERDLVAQVLLAADCVPRGRVVSYGDIAELVGCSPRQVGRIMALHGHRSPWWRVVNHAGELPEHLVGEARQRWASEGIGLKPNGRACRIRDYRAEPLSWAKDWLSGIQRSSSAAAAPESMADRAR